MVYECFVHDNIPRFDGYYYHWNMLIEKFLRSKEFLSIFSNGVKEPAIGTALLKKQKAELDI